MSTEEQTKDMSLMTLKGHDDDVNDVAITPDGKHAVSASDDHTLKVSDLKSDQFHVTFKGHTNAVWSVAITPDGKQAVSASDDNTLKIWDLKTGQCLATFEGHTSSVFGVAITPDGKQAVSASIDNTLKVWDLKTGQCLATLKDHAVPVYGVAITPDGKQAVSASADNTPKVWDLETGQCLATLKGHMDIVLDVAITPDGKQAVSASFDKTLKVWDLKTGRCLATFEGHTLSIWDVTITSDGKQAVSASTDDTLKVWDLKTGQCLATFQGHTNTVYGVAITPDGKQAVSASKDKTLKVWDLAGAIAKTEPLDSTRYTNAKVVLMGESGAGKTGLGIRLTRDEWEMTDSTHGMNLWQLGLPQKKTDGIEHEVWLWDFAGQPDYRLVHQLFMDRTSLAIVVIDPQATDPFAPLDHWEQAIINTSGRETPKLLVAGRVDRGGATVSKKHIQDYCAEHVYLEYIETSAKEGTGREALLNSIADNIPWDKMPFTATTEVFKTLKDEIIAFKAEGKPLVRVMDLKEWIEKRTEKPVPEAELRAVIGLLDGQGLILMLDFGDFVLMKPEHMNAYASAVIRTAREHTGEIGCVLEDDVMAALLKFPEDMERLDKKRDEPILLRALIEMFVKRALCIREDSPKGQLLIFPSYFRLDRPEIEDHPHVFVTYGFKGVLDEVYATLVVKLHYTVEFDKAKLWRYAADFKTKSTAKKRVGIVMETKNEGEAEIKVYMEQEVPDDTKVRFIKYIHEHLRKYDPKVTRVRSYICTHCSEPLEDKRAISKRIETKHKDIWFIRQMRTWHGEWRVSLV